MKMLLERSSLLLGSKMSSGATDAIKWIVTAEVVLLGSEVRVV